MSSHVRPPRRARFGLGAAALLVYGLSLLGAAFAHREPAARDAEAAPAWQAVTQLAAATQPPAAQAATRREPQPVLGFAINFHQTDKLEAYLKAIDEIAAMGFNSVEVLTPSFQQHGASQEIRIEYGQGMSPPREDLVALLKHAHARGLNTYLMPIVLLNDPRGNEWRGKIQPEHWDPWWESYRDMLDHFIEVANEAEVDVLSVGSELLSTEKPQHLDRWEALIAHTRGRFSGKLSYSTNWDHYENPGFWKKLDMIGINGYWDLTTAGKAEHPPQDALVKRWKQIREDVLSFGESQGKPVLLTEIGYPSLPWGLKDPWNYVNASDAKSDPEVQADGYRAFLNVWDDLLARKPDPAKLRGVFFFQWDPHNAGGPDDTGYGIRGKPTYGLLRDWLKNLRRQRGD